MIAFITFAVVQVRFPRKLAPWLLASFLGHIVATFALLYVVLEVYGYGDLIAYHEYGRNLADAMRDDLIAVTPQVFLVLLQQDFSLSVYVPAEGQSTGSMVALTAMFNFLLADSIVAVSLAFSVLSWWGQLLLFQAFRERFPEPAHERLLIGTLCIPSVIFWSSGIVKEAVAVVGVGLFVYGLLSVSRAAWTRGIALAVGGLVMGLVKPYILLTLIAAAGLFVYWERATRRGTLEVRPVFLVIGAAIAVGGAIGIGEIFPRFSLENLGEETARLQAAAFNPQGGSTYFIGDPGERSILGQLAYAPLALATGIFRPLIIEARNPLMAINGLETTLYIFITARALSMRRWAGLLKTTISSPMLMMSLAFVVVFGVAVGLTSANLGTLSRYRMPLVPFFAALLIAWSNPAHAPSPARARPNRSSGSPSVPQRKATIVEPAGLHPIPAIIQKP